MAWIQFTPSLRAALAMGLVIALAGCDRSEVKVYQVAKESPAPPAPGVAALPSLSASEVPAPPQLTWTLPAGWQEVPPGQMRLAQFAVAGPGGKKAEASIVPLGGMAGGELSNVNRWRGQVGLPPVAAAELSRLGEQVIAAGTETRLYDLAGTAASGDKARILVAALQGEDTSWFFKMTGDDELVVAQKPAFIGFLQSLKFSKPSPAAARPAVARPASALPPDHPPLGGGAGMPGASSTKPAWTIPPGWTEEPPTQMLLAKFSASLDAARTEITVSSFPGDVGGLAANVNRWRRQIGLSALDEAAVQQAVTPVEVSAGKGSLVDMTGTDAKTGQPARLIGVAVPQEGQTWFFKIVGDEKVTARERAAFLEFLQTVKLPHAH